MKQYTLIELKAVTSELNVLYVEDEKMIRDGLTASLKQLFKEVEIAEDGAIGWELYKNARFNLVITDISMPNMDGITMISHIKEKNPDAHIIVTSAQNDAEKLLALINLGVDRFLTKPINKINLIDALYSVCSTIDTKRRLKAYHLELEQKIRLLKTQTKKEYIKNQQSTLQTTEKQKLHDDYFSHILQDEKDELFDLNEELDSDILMAFQSDRIDHAYVTRISQHYTRYGAILNSHSAFSDVGLQLQAMSKSFETHENNFIEKIAFLRELLESFNFTLITFRKEVWEKQSAHPTFYNASLISDIQMIQNLLSETDTNNEIEFF